MSPGQVNWCSRKLLPSPVNCLCAIWLDGTTEGFYGLALRPRQLIDPTASMSCFGTDFLQIWGCQKILNTSTTLQRFGGGAQVSNVWRV